MSNRPGLCRLVMLSCYWLIDQLYIIMIKVAVLVQWTRWPGILHTKG